MPFEHQLFQATHWMITAAIKIISNLTPTHICASVDTPNWRRRHHSEHTKQYFAWKTLKKWWEEKNEQFSLSLSLSRSLSIGLAPRFSRSVAPAFLHLFHYIRTHTHTQRVLPQFRMYSGRVYLTLSLDRYALHETTRKTGIQAQIPLRQRLTLCSNTCARLYRPHSQWSTRLWHLRQHKILQYSHFMKILG